MDELEIIAAEPINEVFQNTVHTLSSFGVDISCIATTKKDDDLPMTKLNGLVVKRGNYPTKQELIDWLKFPIEFFEDETTGCSLNTDGCCGCGCCYE